jgi:hypothetical protein
MTQIRQKMNPPPTAKARIAFALNAAQLNQFARQ